MDLIVPKKTDNYILSLEDTLKDRNYIPDKLISELGVFGCILGDDKQIYNNFEAGCLLRSKPPQVNEGTKFDKVINNQMANLFSVSGGIVIGNGVLDTVYLY